MGYILKNTSGLINTRLTDTGRLKLSQGNFKISYFQIGDSEVSYNTLPSSYNQFDTVILEPSFNAQNSSGVPQSNKENVKYPYYVDGNAGNTYGIPFMDSGIDSVYNRAVMRGFFAGNITAETISWSALTNNLYAVNSNYVIKMNTLNGSNKVDLIFNECNKDSLRGPMIGDFITIYYDGKGLVNCECYATPGPTPTPSITPSVTPTVTPTQTPPPSDCFCYTFTCVDDTPCSIEYYDCDGFDISEGIPANTSVVKCVNLSFGIPVFSGNVVEVVNGFCSDPPCSILVSQPLQATDPCASPTPTPTPSATFCPTPTPTKPCPPPPIPDCVMDMQSCYPILTYRIVDICFNQITLDRPTPNFTYLTGPCYARTIIYPPSMVPVYDSETPRPHWNDNVINYESVCFTDEFDVKIWNMNIPWSETPAGINSSIYKDYTQFGSKQFLGTKEYFGYASNSGQTDTSNSFYYNSFGDRVIVTPEEQKAIAVIHYTNNTIDFFYGEKFALEPFEDVDDTTGQARNFKLHFPWLMWHKNPECCLGQTFWVDPTGFEDLTLFNVNYIESSKNVDMNSPGIRYYHLWDNNRNTNGFPNRVGKVFPDSKVIIIDDEELIAAMSYKSNRNWTLPAPRLSLITPNTCGTDNNSVSGILSADSETLYVTYRLTNTALFTNSLHNNYYSAIQGPNLCLPLSSQNVAVRFGGEFYCLNYINPSVTTTTTFPVTTTTTTINCGNCYQLWTNSENSCDVTYTDCDGITQTFEFNVSVSPQFLCSKTIPDLSACSPFNYKIDTLSTCSIYDSCVPCWMSGFTLSVLISGNVKEGNAGFANYFFSPTSEYINGFPIFYNPYLNQNIYFDGFGNWLTNIYNTIVPYNDVFMFNGYSPINIDLFTYQVSKSGESTGYTSCRDTKYFCLLVTKDLYNFVEVTSGSTTYFVSDNYTITYNTSTGNWEFGSDSAIATLSGLTSNDTPIGVWEPISPPNTIISTEGYCNKECGCYSFTGNSLEDQFSYVNCNGVNTLIDILSGETFSLCVGIDTSGAPLFTNFGENPVSFSACSEPCSPILSPLSITCNCYKVEKTGIGIIGIYSYINCDGIISIKFLSSGSIYICSQTVPSVSPNLTLTFISTCDDPLCPLSPTPVTTTTTFNPYVTTTTTYNPYTTTTTTCPLYCDTVPGFYADKFEILVQKVPTGERPSPSEWKIIDFTEQLIPTSLNGFITQEGLTGNTFVITNEAYEDAPYYNLNDYIPLSTVGDTNTQLNFGDEYYFYGNLETDIQATIYEMRYKINLGQAEFQSSSNPSWTQGTASYVTEIGLYDSDKNLMIISKMQSPVLRQGIQQFLIKYDI